MPLQTRSILARSGNGEPSVKATFPEIKIGRGLVFEPGNVLPEVPLMPPAEPNDPDDEPGAVDREPPPDCCATAAPPKQQKNKRTVAPRKRIATPSYAAGKRARRATAVPAAQ